MLAKDLYIKIDNDFIKPGLSDDWIDYMPELKPYFCDNFINTNMGLVCDYTETVNNVFTAVFPSEDVLNKLIDNYKNAMLFVHHASIWNLNKSPVGFYNMNPSLLEKLREKYISIYCIHSPLDNFSEYSTSKTLADALDIEMVKPFIDYRGGVCGIIGKTKYETVNELQLKYSEAVGHDTKLYQYGGKKILDNKVAVCAGGGNDIFVINEVIENNINTLITGVTLKSDYSVATHEFEQEKQINVIGGTHYSSEKFACIAMCKYFSKLGLSAEFIEDEPCLKDM
ncbi:MAG: Nif3-like dinuclear metal center hexameric protein [Treponema sp.]|nr:Nif3-like dinuclear metal center hexameric protein [Treponema sp.]